jgi:hypothetical protein
MPEAFLIVPSHMGVRDLGVQSPTAQLFATKERMEEEVKG